MGKTKKYLDTVTCLENLDIFKYEDLIIGDFKQHLDKYIDNAIKENLVEFASIPDGRTQGINIGFGVALKKLKQVIKEYKP